MSKMTEQQFLDLFGEEPVCEYPKQYKGFTCENKDDRDIVDYIDDITAPGECPMDEMDWAMNRIVEMIEIIQCPPCYEDTDFFEESPLTSVCDWALTNI